MTRSVWLASTAAATFWLGLALPAMAQQGSEAGIEAREDPARPGVLIFDPAFFADARPRTALDMIERLPGFALSGGSSGTRGLAGTAGNVLIGGRHPSTKSEGLGNLLGRISADSVERVELIRGSAPGIDMQGRSVVANVVLKTTVTVERVLGLDAYVYEDGYVGPIVRAEYSRRAGDNQIEGAISATVDRTSNTNEGRRQRFDPSGTLIQDAEIRSWDRFRNVRASGTIQRLQGGGLLRINAVTSWFNNDREQDVFIRAGAGDDDFSEQGFEELSGEIGARWTRPLGPDTELELTGLQQLEVGSLTSGF
ncbi:MAG: Plug domain-containing protein, partial [Brevundimonas sp.]